jgi:RHS repeat-associated protein
VSFKYDPFGRRIYKSSSSGTSVYAYDGDNLVEETNSSGTVVARYTQTRNVDEPLAMLRGGATSYYHADALGSVTSLSNPSGAFVQTYAFDSFGKQTSSSGSLTNPFQYAGRELDGETTLYFMRARYFDPTTGRFLTEDPIGFLGGVNHYDYVFNNPINLVDPSGLAPQWDPNKHRTRECNAEEQAQCAQICGPKGVQSCRVAQQYKVIGLRNGKAQFDWVDGPLSCSCNDPDDPVPVCKPERRRVPFRWPSPNWNRVAVGAGAVVAVGAVVVTAVVCPECLLVLAPALP